MAQKRQITAYVSGAIRLQISQIADELALPESRVIERLLKRGVRRWEKKRYGERTQTVAAHKAVERSRQRPVASRSKARPTPRGEAIAADLSGVHAVVVNGSSFAFGFGGRYAQ